MSSSNAKGKGECFALSSPDRRGCRGFSEPQGGPIWVLGGSPEIQKLGTSRSPSSAHRRIRGNPPNIDGVPCVVSWILTSELSSDRIRDLPGRRESQKRSFLMDSPEFLKIIKTRI